MTRCEMTETEMMEWARNWSHTAEPHTVVWLSGELGTGKTTLVRAVLEGLGAEAPASSPSYELVHRHATPAGEVYHLDCYRMRSPGEARELDWEAFGRGHLTLIEWPERAGTWVPEPRVRIRLSHVPDPTRRGVEIRR